MRWYPLSTKEAFLLLGVFLITGIFSTLQQYFVEPATRPYTYTFVLFLLMFAYFPAAKPTDPPGLAKFLSMIVGVIFAVMIVLKDLIVRQNLTWGIVVVIAGAFLSPLIAGWLYSLTVRRPRP